MGDEETKGEGGERVGDEEVKDEICVRERVKMRVG